MTIPETCLVRTVMKLSLTFTMCGLVFGCASMEQAGEAYKTDMTPMMERQAMAMRARAPAPIWQDTSLWPEIDEMLPGPDDDTVLIGFLDLRTRYPNSMALVPYFGPYELFNARTGERIWSYERKPDPDLSYSVVSTDPVLVVLERDQNEVRIVAVDSYTGVQLWENTIESDSVQVFTNTDKQTILVRVAGDEPGLTGMDLLSGKTLWSRQVTAGNLIIEFGDEVILLVSETVEALDLRSGRTEWQTSNTQASGRPVSVVVRDDGYVVAWDNGAICFISQSGILRWQSSVGDTPELSTTAGELAIVEVAAQEHTNGRLQALALKDGKLVWRHDLAERVFSALTLDGERLVFSTETTIQAVAMTSGKLLFKQPLARRSGNRLPDHVVIFPDHIVVASEIVVSAHERSGGDEIWSLALAGGDHLTARASRAKLGGMVVGSGNNAVADNIASYSASINAMQAQSDFYTKQARQNYENTYMRTQRKMSSGNAADRAEASFERSLAASHMENVNTINRSFDTMMMSTQMAFNVLAAGQAVEQNARYGAAAAERDRAIRRLLMAHKIHERAIQNWYFVRPFSSRTGNGLVLVDMWDGRWAEIPTSPSEAFLEDRIYMNLNLGLIRSGDAFMVTKGTGLDPDKWNADDRFEAGGIKSTMFAFALDDRYRTVLIRRSLLGYDVGNAIFHDLETYETESLTKKKSRIIN